MEMDQTPCRNEVGWRALRFQVYRHCALGMLTEPGIFP